MITIDQLLESVDLNFEPRWVTSTKDRCVCIWEREPSQIGYYWDAPGGYSAFSGLKLAEFDGKGWRECIYEVPLKTTGKIEKLLEQKLTIGKTKYEYPTHAMLMGKINELVDAVNELKGAKNE